VGDARKIRHVAGGVVLLDGRVVLHRTAKGNVNFPKGKIEPGESAEQAAAREVFEETGLVAEVVAELGTLDLLHVPKPQTIRLFLMRATAAPSWAEHAGRDAELASVDEVAGRLTFKEYRRFWRGVAARVAEAAAIRPGEIGRPGEADRPG
jgi:8-oxo-dGTP pyrophosphatase MutT (NUDIX family)